MGQQDWNLLGKPLFIPNASIDPRELVNSVNDIINIDSAYVGMVVTVKGDNIQRYKIKKVTWEGHPDSFENGGYELIQEPKDLKYSDDTSFLNNDNEINIDTLKSKNIPELLPTVNGWYFTISNNVPWEKQALEIPSYRIGGSNMLIVFPSLVPESANFGDFSQALINEYDVLDGKQLEISIFDINKCSNGYLSSDFSYKFIIPLNVNSTETIIKCENGIDLECEIGIDQLTNKYAIEIVLPDEELNPNDYRVVLSFSNILDTSGKVDKISNPINGNLPKLDSNGNLVDSGISANSVLTQHLDISGKADKVTGSNLTNKLVTLDEGGNIQDGGITLNALRGELDEEYVQKPSTDPTNGQILSYNETNETTEWIDNTTVHIKYAANTTPTESLMHDSIQPEDFYIGIYSDNNSDASTNYSDYQWSQIIGKSALQIYNETYNTSLNEADFINVLKQNYPMVNLPYNQTAAEQQIGTAFSQIDTLSASSETVGKLYIMPNDNNNPTNTILFVTVLTPNITPAEYKWYNLGELNIPSNILTENNIDGTGLVNSLSNALAKAIDVMPLSAKLKGVTLSENKVLLVNDENFFDGYYINPTTGKVASSSSNNAVLCVPVNDVKEIRFLGFCKAGSAAAGSAFGFSTTQLSTDNISDYQLQLWEEYKNGAETDRAEQYVIEVPNGMDYFVCTVRKGSSTPIMTIDDFYCYLISGKSVVDMVNNVQQSVDVLDKQMNGQTFEEKKIEINVSTGESGSIGLYFYPLGEVLEVGKAYRLVIDRDLDNTGTNVVGSVRVTLKNANDNSLQFKTSQTGSVRTYVDTVATKPEYILYPVDENISKLGIFVNYSEVFERNKTFKVTFYLQEYEEVKGDIEKINNRLDEVEADVTELSHDVEEVTDNVDSLDKQVNGYTINEEKLDLTITTPAPGTGAFSITSYELGRTLRTDKSYKINIVRDPEETGTNVVNNITFYFKNSSEVSRQFKLSANGRVRTLYSCPATYQSFNLYPIDDDITKLAIYIPSAEIAVRNANFGISVVLQEYEEVEGDIEKINNRLDEVEAASSTAEQKNSTLAGDIINLDRPYYFNNGWKQGAVIKNYLEEKLRLVPKGKHFLTFSDNHVDYNGSILNSDGTAYVQVLDYGLYQKLEIIMKYVSDRLGNCKVLYSGDLIGAKDKVNGSVEQQKTVFDWFGGNMFKYVGTDFLPCLGDHDINQLRCDNSVTGADRNTWYSYIYQTMFKSLRLSPKVEFDDRGIAAIDTLDSTVLDDYKKEGYKLWMNFHYFMDDPQNKIRFIVLEDLAGYSPQDPVTHIVPDQAVFSSYLGPCIQLPFVGYALNTCPDDYDVVILCHEANHTLSQGFKSTNAWEKTRLFPMFSAFKNRTSYTLSRPGSTTATTTAVFNAVMSAYGNATYDFSSKTGRIVLFRGDVHYCGATYADGANNSIHIWSPEYVPSTNDILEVIVERTCLVQNEGFTSPMSSTSNPYIERSVMEKTVKNHSLLGTVNEVLFDIVTITDDNKVVCTRVGTSPVTRCMDIPFTIFDKDSDYAVGDVVLWDERTVDGLGKIIPKSFNGTYSLNDSLEVENGYRLVIDRDPNSLDDTAFGNVQITFKNGSQNKRFRISPTGNILTSLDASGSEYTIYPVDSDISSIGIYISSDSVNAIKTPFKITFNQQELNLVTPDASHWTRFLYKFTTDSYAANHVNDVDEEDRTTFPVGYENEVEVMDVSDIPYTRTYSIAVKQEENAGE